MKIAERVGNRAIEASIQELRYAARRAVQADQIRLAAGTRDLTKEENDNWQKHTVEACENCVKARDDAVDSAVMFMTCEVEKVVNKVGLQTVVTGFPDVFVFRKNVREIDRLIVASRANRSKLDACYSEIEKNSLLPGTIELFGQFRDSTVIAAALKHDEEQARIEYGKRQFQSGLKVTLGITAFLFALFTGIVSSVVGNLLTRLFPPSP